MDFSEIKERAADIFSDLKSKAEDFIQENKMISIAIAAMIILILVCIILLAVLAGGKKDKEEQKIMNLELSTELVIPNGPELPGNYNVYRESEEKWTEEEGRQWFTNPTDKEINSLSQANQNLIEDIIEAAP